MTTGEKIAKLRKQAGLSQEAFSEKLSISRQAVSKWENGSAIPTNENLSQISRLFGVQVSSLLDDEDLIFSDAPAKPSEEEFTVEKTKNSVTNIFQSAAIIILALAVIVQGISMGRMQKDISSMSAQIADTNRLQREIESLRSYVYSMPSRYTENSNDFTDYQYSNTGYDFATNMAKLQFSVVPTNYSAATQAKIVIKGRSDSFSADAVLENGIFTADVDVYCEDNMPVYLYLTDNGQTRSFLLDYIANPADSYRLQLRESSFEGQMKVSEGAVELEGMYNVTVDYSIYEENEKSVYPVKAVLEIYADDRLIKEIPHENIMGFDFVQEGKIYLDTTGEQHAATSVGFGLWVKEDIKNDIISLGSDISFVLRVHDNKNSEYLHTTDMFTYISE